MIKVMKVLSEQLNFFDNDMISTAMTLAACMLIVMQSGHTCDKRISTSNRSSSITRQQYQVIHMSKH